METDNVLLLNFEGIAENDDVFAKECSKLSQSLQTGEIQLTELVQDLGVYLVHKSPERRAYGTGILARVLELLPTDFLNSAQLHFIGTFYGDRLKDNHLVIPSVLRGILTITRQNNLPDGECAAMLASLFHNVPCQQQQQADRHVIYRIFQTMLEKKENELKAMNLEFVYGVLTAMEGERDPRGLLLLFGWLPRFLRSVGLGQLTEEMFEAISCYFPVDFRVPARNAMSISRETLAEALCPCLCAIPEFAEFAVPLALEKLASTLRIAKLDSLDLLRRGCSVFPEEAYLVHSSELWPSIHREVLNSNGNDPELERCCLDTLTAFVAKISKDNTDTFRQVLRNITDTSIGNLRPDQKLFACTVKILTATAMASTSSATQVLNTVQPILMNLYGTTDIIGHKVAIFEALIAFYRCDVDQDFLKDPSVVRLCVDTAVSGDPALRAVGLSGLAVLTKHLDASSRFGFYEHLKTMLVTRQEPNVCTALCTCLESFAVRYADELRNLIEYIEPSTTFLNHVCCLAGSPGVAETVISMIVGLCLLDSAAIKILLRLIQTELENRDVQAYLRRNEVVSQLVRHAINAIYEKNDLRDLSEVFKLIIGTLASTEQGETVPGIVNEIVAAFKTDRRTVFVYLLDGLVCRLRKDVLQDFDVIEDLADFALTCEDEVERDTSVQLLSNMVNKLPDDENLSNHISKLEDKCDNFLTNDSAVETNINVVTAWIAKALLMRGHRLATTWITKLAELLGKYKSAAIGFKIIMRDDYDALSMKSYCNKRLLYRQLFFVTACELLTAKCNEENGNYLLAIGYVLEEVPNQILKMYFDKILRLLILCLDKCPDPSSLSAILSTLRSLIESNDPLAESYMQEFLPRLMRLTKFDASMKVRMTAVQCLGRYTIGYTLYKLLPHKSDVVSALGECLDDRKRLVRRAAAEARLKWYLVDAPV